jgi:ribonuclease Z
MTPPTPPTIATSNHVDTFYPVVETGVKLTPQLARLFEQARDNVKATIQPQPRPGDDVVVTTLGTGSSMPSKYRNGESLP